MNIWNAGRLDPDLLQDYVDNGTAEESERAQRMLDKMMEKGSHGEGSRGGNVTGHTLSGKPVYGPRVSDLPHDGSSAAMLQGMSRASHPAYGDFTREDHHDAAAVHDAHAKSAYAESKLSKHDPNHPTFDRESHHANTVALLNHDAASRAHADAAHKSDIPRHAEAREEAERSGSARAARGDRPEDHDAEARAHGIEPGHAGQFRVRGDKVHVHTPSGAWHSTVPTIAEAKRLFPAK